MIKKILVRNGRVFYWSKGDLHTDFGVVKEADINKDVPEVRSHIGKGFIVMNANFADNIENIKRGPAIVTKKDIGLILAYTSIDKDSVVLEAGTGSGVLAAHLARFVKRVYSYEINTDFYNLAKKNLENLGVKNVVLINKDVTKGIGEKNLDLVVLDMNEPWKVLPFSKALKSGCFFVAYLPTIVQVMELIKEAKDMFYVKTVELLEREWHIEGQRVRPKSQMIAHTGFLVFLRKI